MKKNIFLLFLMLTSISAMAWPIRCDDNRGYSLKSFTQPKEQNLSIGLVDDDNSDDVITKIPSNNVETCSIFDVDNKGVIKGWAAGFAMGAKLPVASIKHISADDVGYGTDGAFLKKTFDCFCKINSNLLDHCSIGMSYYDNLSNNYYDDKVTCLAGKTKEVKTVIYVPTGPCFVAGTKVLTPSGDKNIEAFKVGDDVLAYDHKDNTVKTSKVTKVFKHKNKKYGELYLSNGTKLLVTAEHRFYSVDKKDYVRAGKLKANEKLLLNNGKGTETVTVTKYVKSVAKADVYNITVKDFNNYFAEKILVHNLK